MASTLFGIDAHEGRDLAFLLRESLPDETSGHAAREVHIDPPFVIGVSPMAFGLAGIWPRADMDVFSNMRDAIVGACKAFLSDGHALEFFITDTMDHETVQSIVTELEGWADTQGGVSYHRGVGPDHVRSILDRLDVAIVARLHGVILSQIQGVPAVGVAHNWKVREQLSLSAAGEPCFAPDEVTGEELARATYETIRQRQGIRDRVEAFSRAAGAVASSDVDRGFS